MLPALLRDNTTNDATDTSVAMVLQPVMSYTRRPIGYEVKCSRPWGVDAVRWNVELAADGETPAALFLAQVGEALPILTVPLSMSVEHCTASLPAGALLLMESPAATFPTSMELVAHCSALKSAGFQVGIADYQGEAIWKQLIPTLSHVRFGCKGPLLAAQRELLSSSLRQRITFVANGVETRADLKEAMQAGFQLFQGSFAHRISQLYWPAQEFQQRALLLQEACEGEGASADLLARCLTYGNLCMRFGTLLLSMGLTALGVVTNPEVLHAELGAERVQQLLQISLAEDMAGGACPLLLHKLFQQARFHELMRSYALSLPSPTARFEGLMLGALAAIRETAAEQSASKDAAALLKHSLGIPMECGAFYRNLAIVDAYSCANWSEAERLGRADGYAPAVLGCIFQKATIWAHQYARLTHLENTNRVIAST